MLQTYLALLVLVVVLALQVEKELFHLNQVEEDRIINGKSNFSIYKTR